MGGGLTWAEASVVTPYGRASSSWTLDGTRLTLRVEVPVSTACTVVLPDGTTHERASGTHVFEAEVPPSAVVSAEASEP